MNVQRCRTCDKIKNIEEFNFRKSRNKYNTQCKQCKKEYENERYLENKKVINEKSKKYYYDNKEYLAPMNKNYYTAHKEEIHVQKKEYYQENKSTIKANQKQYRVENKEKIRTKTNEWVNNRLKTDLSFRLKRNISRNINLSLRSVGSSKVGRSIRNYIPYTIEQLRQHLESQFDPWMSWENWGRYDAKAWNDDDQSTWTWQIDHIIPHSTFKYSSMEDENFKKCWALENLRPLNSKQNYLDGINRVRHNTKNKS